MKFQKYDLIFGIGYNCNNSLGLRKCNLQIASYPFDWLDCSDFETNLNFILNDFKNFLNKDDLEKLPDLGNEINDRYRNNYSKLQFVHDFPVGEDFDVQYLKVKEKYDKRISRLQNKIQNSKRVLIVYFSYVPVNIETLREKCKDFNGKLKVRFPNTEISYLYVVNAAEQNFDFVDNNLNLRIVADDFSVTKRFFSFLGIRFSTKFFKLHKILKTYKLNMSSSEKMLSLKYYLQKALLNLIPNKQLSLNLRHKNKYR